ncbi:MAG: phospholipase D-like domain-containing protein, partial [Bacteriovorax sp.]|nr:phospholipase D-like domain-containing protein [Bacteriovorax sp.]
MKFWLIFLFILSCNSYGSDLNPFKASVESDHQITLLNHGAASLEKRLQMIEGAQTSIDIEYYIYNIDQSGKMITQALIKKAQEGVRVRIILDY